MVTPIKNNKRYEADMDVISREIIKDTTMKFLENAATSRRRIQGEQDGHIDPRRDLNEEFGYPETSEITAADFKHLYTRSPIAQRVNDLYPDESWLLPPKILETTDLTEETDFELAIVDLDKALQPQKDSWYKDRKQPGSTIWNYLLRLDKASGIGSFGALLFGFDDPKGSLEDPVKILDIPSSGKSQTILNKDEKNLNLLFLRVFDQSQVEIVRYEDDPNHPRFGKPELYEVKFQVPTNEGSTIKEHRVHWTRILHTADNPSSNEVFASSRLLASFNRILDLEKIYGSCAEMYFLGALMGLNLTTHPSLGGDVEIDIDTIRSALEEYHNSVSQRDLITQGMVANPLAPQVVSPKEQVEVLLDSICIEKAVPKSIFLGLGEEDKVWNGRVMKRQRFYLTPHVIVKFFDTLIAAGVLPEPKNGYSIQWPDLNALTEDEKAKILLDRTKALITYVKGEGNRIIPKKRWLVHEFDVDPDEVDDVLDELEEEEPIGSSEQDTKLTTDLSDQPQQISKGSPKV